jgi:hypothetical protein
MIERDYLMRMMAQLTAVIARIFGCKNAQDYTQALQVVREAYGEIFGLPSELVEQMDAATLALLLGDKEKIKALASLLHEEGEVLILQGEKSEGMKKYEKALALYREVLSMQTQDDPDCRTAIALLQTKLTGGI